MSNGIENMFDRGFEALQGFGEKIGDARYKDNAIKTATKYSNAHSAKRSEDNKMRKKLKIRKGSWMNASRTKSGGWTVQRDYINKSFNGSGKRSRYSA